MEVEKKGMKESKLYDALPQIVTSYRLWQDASTSFPLLEQQQIAKIPRFSLLQPRRTSG